MQARSSLIGERAALCVQLLEAAAPLGEYSFSFDRTAGAVLTNLRGFTLSRLAKADHLAGEQRL